MKNLQKCVLTIFFMVLVTDGISQVESTSEGVELQEESGNRKGRKEKIKAHKTTYLKENMSLSSQESDVFWPLYNDFMEKKMTLRKSGRKENKEHKRTKEGNSDKQLTDVEMSQIIQARMQFKTDLFELEKEFHENVMSVLPVKKVYLFYKSEREFKKKLIRKMRNRNKKNK